MAAEALPQSSTPLQLPLPLVMLVVSIGASGPHGLPRACTAATASRNGASVPAVAASARAVRLSDCDASVGSSCVTAPSSSESLETLIESIAATKQTQPHAQSSSALVRARHLAAAAHTATTACSSKLRLSTSEGLAPRASGANARAEVQSMATRAPESVHSVAPALRRVARRVGEGERARSKKCAATARLSRPASTSQVSRPSPAWNAVLLRT
eukprot:6188106-Pleurochrysis_carterae.AAC.1